MEISIDSTMHLVRENLLIGKGTSLYRITESQNDIDLNDMQFTSEAHEKKPQSDQRIDYAMYYQSEVDELNSLSAAYERK